MFFDMIGDRWGIKHAAIASSLLLTIYPIILYYLRKILQPLYDLTYSRIELNDPREFEIKIDHNKIVITKVEIKEDGAVLNSNSNSNSNSSRIDDNHTITSIIHNNNL